MCKCLFLRILCHKKKKKSLWFCSTLLWYIHFICWLMICLTVVHKCKFGKRINSLSFHTMSYCNYNVNMLLLNPPCPYCQHMLELLFSLFICHFHARCNFSDSSSVLRHSLTCNMRLINVCICHCLCFLLITHKWGARTKTAEREEVWDSASLHFSGTKAQGLFPSLLSITILLGYLAWRLHILKHSKMVGARFCAGNSHPWACVGVGHVRLGYARLAARARSKEKKKISEFTSPL